MNFLDSKSYDDLVTSAEKAAADSQAEYRELVAAYYLSRFFMAKFESISHSIPVHVLNEYRNSLDHLIRSFVADEENKKIQVQRASSHVLRALGDTVKLICHELSSQIDDELSSYSNKSLSLVNNGNLIRQIKEKRDLAQHLFTNAKVHDVTRSSDRESGIRTEVLMNYINSAFAYEQAKEYLSNANSILSELSLHEEERALRKAKSRINSLISAAGFAIGSGVLAGLFFEAPWVSVIASAIALTLAVFVLIRKED